MTTPGRPRTALLLAALVAASLPAHADADEIFNLADTLFPGAAPSRVTLGYQQSADAWMTQIGGAAYVEYTGGGYAMSTLYGTLLGFELHGRMGYPVYPQLPMLSMEASLLVAPFWFRVGPMVLRLSGTAGIGLGGPPSAYALFGARAQLFTDWFGVHLHGQHIPGSAANPGFKDETRLEGAMSIGPVHLGVRWTGSTYGYNADDNPTPPPDFLVIRARTSLGGFVGYAF